MKGMWFGLRKSYTRGEALRLAKNLRKEGYAVYARKAPAHFGGDCYMLYEKGGPVPDNEEMKPIPIPKGICLFCQKKLIEPEDIFHGYHAKCRSEDRRNGG
jgi:hypothetical protein